MFFINTVKQKFCGNVPKGSLNCFGAPFWEVA